MSTIAELLTTRNPLLAHGPRTHDTGIRLQADAPVAPRRRAPRDVDAPRVHLGPAGRR